ncbi:hypothetical protein PFFCH_01116 [Plasmodium falciparum FCH/4]|uniref:Uncharacterized protein n=1 Tax=Plasmodium falciparum FCH/4 TaxID=1036724 RepID=A0A024VSN4_PLAFA|nr:hypothetical protein PFFCH_01116 [Plasmodium falciparum FCH/4]
MEIICYENLIICKLLIKYICITYNTKENYTIWYLIEDLITESLYFEFKATCLTSASENDSLLCFYGRKSGFVPGTSVSSRDVIGTTVKEIVKKSTNAATQAAETAANETTSGMIEAELSKITSAGANLHSAITYSVTAILVIVLVMKKKNEEKIAIYKIIKGIDIRCRAISGNLKYCEFFI